MYVFEAIKEVAAILKSHVNNTHRFQDALFIGFVLGQEIMHVQYYDVVQLLFSFNHVSVHSVDLCNENINK